MRDVKCRTSAIGRRSLLWLALLQAVAAHAQERAATQPADAPEQSESPSPQADARQQQDAKAAGSATAPAGRNSPKDQSDTAKLETITVTAQKKVENIQKVPIAITAFGGEDLSDRKIETGGDLVTATPNVSFTKTNFASYNFQIRGIGTQALSVTTDPAVAVSFNSTPMIRNRLFEQEYFDVDRVEVLRGPQGTLYGRNATAGVVNMIPNLPSFDGFESWVKGELGNYDSRRFSGMVNVPLSDSLAFRAAGAWTDRSGYDYNSVTRKDVNGRELWSGRVSLAWRPTEGINASIVWEHFDEDDDRSRTGKQLCHTDQGPETIGNTAVPDVTSRNFMSQGCKDGSLYGDGAFGVPNGGSLPQVLAAGGVPGVIGLLADGSDTAQAIPRGLNPFAGVVQSKDLRRIATTYDPIFRAKNDVVQFNFDAELRDDLKFVSQTLYTRDRYYSSQDYGRFQSNPIFSNTSDGSVVSIQPDGSFGPPYNLLPNGKYCDPQLGCSDRFLEVDLSRSYSTQWSQEFRLQSSSDGPFNFNLGANYLYYKVDEDYFVFNNVFTLLAENYFNRTSSAIFPEGPSYCAPGQTVEVSPGVPNCVYIDPNPLSRISGDGHNYFRSRNIADTRSAALFGEAYWQLSDTLKLTTGLRYTDDRKSTTPVPSQLLLAPGLTAGGTINSGYPELSKIHQKWDELTGRVVLDWTPQLSFTDSTLIYTSFSRGYKAGGTNSPGIGANPDLGFMQRDPRFKPEFVNAFEVGMKNVMADGKLTFNATLFYNDYKNYQISQIQDRATLNENFDAKTWGLELEAAWKPTPAFQLSGNVGLLGTRLAGGQYSLDVMNRTQGNPDWVLVRPWVQQASNCIAPRSIVEQVLAAGGGFYLTGLCPGLNSVYGDGFREGSALSQLTGIVYNPDTDAPNGGQGILAKVGGHSLPNAPHVTVSLSPSYTFFTARGNLILRADLYYQGESWARIYQDKIDRLHDWGNVNLSLTYEELKTDLTVQLYVKNVLNGSAITGTFVNSDDTGLTANVFTQDPRIIGLSIRKGFY
ncbi:TonB-dependent receptor [Dokdonella sp.]|uniref:TonB-dependent receptor n=1 Tax=Dokdonella sp. TaxID=2291710 RepID=UPI001B294D9B|nr:TonB-dependent receptor [Dokdonella sp.]MBO9663750.1 TonB-dependent receptor [Dokdonella sp.]